MTITIEGTQEEMTGFIKGITEPPEVILSDNVKLPQELLDAIATAKVSPKKAEVAEAVEEVPTVAERCDGENPFA